MQVMSKQTQITIINDDGELSYEKVQKIVTVTGNALQLDAMHTAITDALARAITAQKAKGGIV